MGRPNPPKQERSQRTLDRLVEACEGLLRVKPFEAISVAELARAGRSSVGAFYGRFPGKDSLLDFLDARGEREVLRAWDGYFAKENWKDISAEEVIRRFVEFSVRSHRSRKGIVRALFLRLRANPTREIASRTKRLNRRVIEGLKGLLLERRSEIRHPRPERAIAFGLVMVVTTIRERVVFEDLDLYPERLRDEELVEELVRAFTSYLGVVRREGRRKARTR
jgi:AcrR family transcriptional regulator